MRRRCQETPLLRDTEEFARIIQQYVRRWWWWSADRPSFWSRIKQALMTVLRRGSRGSKPARVRDQGFHRGLGQCSWHYTAHSYHLPSLGMELRLRRYFRAHTTRVSLRCDWIDAGYHVVLPLWFSIFFWIALTGKIIKFLLGGADGEISRIRQQYKVR